MADQLHLLFQILGFRLEPRRPDDLGNPSPQWVGIIGRQSRKWLFLLRLLGGGVQGLN
jgi:hypothetical protein